MPYDIIRRSVESLRPPPNLRNYEETRRRFSWEGVRSELAGLPAGKGLNIAHEAVDRHAAGPLASHIALRWLGKGGARRELTYAELARQSNRFANVLAALGVRRGDRVFSLLGRVPELYITALGSLKLGAVFCPLFSAFGPEPLQARLEHGDAKVLVSTPHLYRRKVQGLRAGLSCLEHVLLVGSTTEVGASTDVEHFDALLDAASPHFEIPATDPQQPALLHFTSGTTGTPKGALHVHEAVLVHYITGKYVLDLQPGDVFWCTADPGWVTGTSYGIIAPWVCGVTNLIDEAELDVERWYTTLEREQVSVWYTAPTAVRMLMKAGSEPLASHRFEKLRHIASVGEPLNPEAVVWGAQTFGIPICDNWWQTETGGIMIANYPAVDVKPGSMGLPLPGVEAAIARHSGTKLESVTEPDVEGLLVLRPNWPSMFRTYVGDEERYAACFVDGWYVSGDLARRDADGYFWFVGRSDDVIKSAGHLIGPFEVESALLEHPAVAEVGVIGKPDPIAGAIVKAFVELKPGVEATDALRRELLGFARQRLGPAVAPKEIDFHPGLPRTRSGKIMRRLLKARELGLPEGDLSTLEDAP